MCQKVESKLNAIYRQADDRRAVKSGLSAGLQTFSVTAMNRSGDLESTDAEFYRGEGCEENVLLVGWEVVAEG
jgi:hypothetical protein